MKCRSKHFKTQNGPKWKNGKGLKKKEKKKGKKRKKKRKTLID